MEYKSKPRRREKVSHGQESLTLNTLLVLVALGSALPLVALGRGSAVVKGMGSFSSFGLQHLSSLTRD